ncbi:MAG: hypothetical protein PWP45_1793, partial [Tepidanaerobacteraceae bacterium]|nr:hypothetical protein [Tepidanaerobacteraceae bacterium]
GKIRIKSSIINKEGSLTEEEYEEVKRHAEYGYSIYNYCKYTFANIAEATRDKLFRQIFRKQIELRKQVKY